MLIKLLNLNYIIEMSTPYSRNFSGAGGIYVNDLPRVATRQCGGRETNLICRSWVQRPNHNATDRNIRG